MELEDSATLGQTVLFPGSGEEMRQNEEAAAGDMGEGAGGSWDRSVLGTGQYRDTATERKFLEGRKVQR